MDAPTPGSTSIPAPERTEPAPDQRLAEREMLLGWLDYHRATLVWKCSGLTDEHVKLRPVAPSTLSLLGLLRHMTEVERNWFHSVLAGEDATPVYFSQQRPNDDFDDLDSVPVAQVLAGFERACAHARALVAASDSFDVEGIGRGGERVSLRWIVTHMVEEYARHNGHADLLREAIDGVTGE